MLTEADSSLTTMAMNSGRFHGDQYLLVRFFLHPWHNKQRSEEEGRPIYEEKTYIEIMQPGNKDSIVKRPATNMDKQRFAEHFRKFEARSTDEHIEGTLLSEWPGISRAQVEELKFLNVRTVEQLANIADSNAQNIMGIQGLKTKANKYLEDSKGSVVAAQLADLQEKYEALLEAQNEIKPKRGRRTKAKMEKVSSEE